jgi:hypothetical protein
MRAAVNAIFYLLRTGCPWRYLRMALDVSPVSGHAVETSIDELYIPPQDLIAKTAASSLQLKKSATAAITLIPHVFSLPA